MVMRLPASLELTDLQGKKITMYLILEPYRRGELRISLVTEPSCRARYCQFGYIAAFQNNQNSDNFHLAQRSSGVPVNLGEKVRGVYVAVDPKGASSGPYGLVIWEQNNLSFLVSLPFNPNLTLAQNKQKIISIATSMVNEPPIYDIATANSQIVTDRSQQLSRCVRWSVFSQSLGEMGRGAPYQAFNELPNGFKQGCIFFQDNNSIDVAYVLMDGVEPSGNLTNGQFSYGGTPSFTSEQSKQFEDLIARGQALMITWLTPTQGSLSYVRSIPKDRAFVRDDGMVCFNTVCMKSSAVSNQELSRILEAGQIATGRSPSPRQQTTTGRSLLVTANSPSLAGETVEPGSSQELKDLKWNAAISIVVDRLNSRKLSNGSAVYSFDLYNLGYADAVVEVYDARENLVEVRGVDGVRNPNSVYGFPVEAVERLVNLAKEGFGFSDPRNAVGQQKKTEIRNLVVPPGGYFKITKTGANANAYNQATFLMGLFFDTELPGSLPGAIKNIFGDNATLQQSFLSALFVKLQQKRIGNIVRDGGFANPAIAFINGSWIDQENLEKLMNIGIEVVAEEGLKQGVSRTVINEQVLGRRLNFWVTAAETFAKGGNIFLQSLDWERAQRAEQKQGSIRTIGNN
jgi:hypothetical protein